MKAYGIPGRPRLFEVVQKVREINLQRERRAPHRTLNGASFLAEELEKSPELRMDYIIARPRMARYMAVRYPGSIKMTRNMLAPEDIHVYSIDEVFMEVTRDPKTQPASTARELAMRMILDVLSETGITATAGIGTNLYLCKVAMDIGAKLEHRAGCERRSHCGAERAFLPQEPLGSSAPDGFLAGGPRLRPKAGIRRAAYHGATRPAVRWAAPGNITTRTFSTSFSA